MASIPLASSFLAGSLLSILVPICVLIAIAVWHIHAIRSIPDNPTDTAPHAAGAAEVEGRPEAEGGAASTTP